MTYDDACRILGEAGMQAAQECADEAPPLTDRQRLDLAALLRPAPAVHGQAVVAPEVAA